MNAITQLYLKGFWLCVNVVDLQTGFTPMYRGEHAPRTKPGVIWTLSVFCVALLCFLKVICCHNTRG